jgi:hypothetical protein
VMVEDTESNSYRLVIHSTAAISVINCAAAVGKEMTCRVREITFTSGTTSTDARPAHETSLPQHSKFPFHILKFPAFQEIKVTVC